ncbi:MAG: hypothetical protein EZS28_056430, partial [Streblomastix strix]
ELPVNSESDFVRHAPSKIKVSSAPDLTNDDPVTVNIPTIEHMNLQVLLKADKTQLIDSYTKGETDNLLINKADTGVFYTKGEDDTLLFTMADKTQLIDAYTKSESNNLLNNKADTGVSYTKGEDNALLLLKADKTQLIDSYTKGETDNLLNNK